MRSLAVLAVVVLIGEAGCGSSAGDQGPGPAGTDASSESDASSAADAAGGGGNDATSGGPGSGDSAAEGSSSPGEEAGTDAAGVDAMPGVSDGGSDGASVSDAGSDAAGSCPPTQPADSAPCSGTASCQYGHSTCCGVQYSAVTCKCQVGGFACAMTVECNFVCPDSG
jgi:hypothetical protein